MRWTHFSCFFLLLSPLCGMASWQIAGESIRTPGDQPNKLVAGTPTLYTTKKPYSFTTHKGYLIENARQFASSNGWHLKWFAKRDYRMNIVTEISGPSFSVAMDRLVENYPLKTNYNWYNKTVTVRRG